jgi:hypothetical protein
MSAARRWGVATTPDTGGATSYGPGPSASGGSGPRVASTSLSTRSMLPEARGAGAAARGDGAFRAPPGDGPRRVRVLKVPGAARFTPPRIGAPRRRGPLVSGVHRVGTFSLFLLPEGRPRRFAPKLVSAAAEEAEGFIGLGGHWGRNGTGGRE